MMAPDSLALTAVVLTSNGYNAPNQKAVQAKCTATIGAVNHTGAAVAACPVTRKLATAAADPTSNAPVLGCADPWP